MIEGFYDFYSLISAIFKIFFLLGLGYLLYVKRLIRKETADGLSNILIWVCVPALIFTKITSTFNPFDFPKWWILPICSIAMAFLGLGIGYLFQRPFRDFNARREFMASCAFQNSGYLPMTRVVFACSGQFCDRILVYIFLFLMGFNITIWSFAPAFLSKDIRRNFRPTAILNAPVIATILSILWVILLPGRRLHNIIYDPLVMLGNSSFPLALIVLGAYLAEYRGFSSENWKALTACLSSKLVFLPALIFILLRFLPLEQDLKFFILLESTMPVAVSMVVIGQYAGADNRFLSGAIFYSHLLAILTIPLWLNLIRFFL